MFIKQKINVYMKIKKFFEIFNRICVKTKNWFSFHLWMKFYINASAVSSLLVRCSASICFNQANTSREFGISIWLSRLDSLCTFCQSLINGVSQIREDCLNAWSVSNLVSYVKTLKITQWEIWKTRIIFVIIILSFQNNVCILYVFFCNMKFLSLYNVSFKFETITILILQY